MREREYMHPEQRVMIKFNYWDYIKGFNKEYYMKMLIKNIHGS